MIQYLRRTCAVKKEELQVFSLLEFRPEQGAIYCRSERMLLLSALAFGGLLQHLVGALGLDGARRVLRSFGYRHGFHAYLEAEELFGPGFGRKQQGDVIGPRLPELMGFQSHENVQIYQSDNPRSFRIEVDFRNSVEAEQCLIHSGQSQFPVCWWSVAFASGYCSAVLGEVYFEEISCAAQGNARCHVIGQDALGWGTEADRLRAEYGFANAQDAEALGAELRLTHQKLKKQKEGIVGMPRSFDSQPKTPGRQRAEETAESDGFVVREESVMEALEQAVSVAKLDTPVLVEGETGTGKEFVVNLIHRSSARAEHELISVNCAALTETLLESELFGHVRGAFTGAVSDSPGLFKLADGGTLFLDEIGDMPPSLQAKLLRVLETGEVRRIGSSKTIHTSARILAATNKNLQAMVEAGQFRRDLYFRLNNFVIYLPALRERTESIPAMVHLFLGQIGEKSGKHVRTVSPEVMTRLLEYKWPGNVRELKHAIERAVLVCRDGVLRLGDLPQEIAFPLKANASSVPESCLSLEEGEAQVISRMLTQHRGNRMATATALNISVSTLWRKMRRYDLQY
jgi:DNA-binding NtrC family response regulator/predicted hydrocarbon binding protein